MARIFVCLLATALGLTAAACPGPGSGDGGVASDCHPGNFVDDAGPPGTGPLALIIGTEDAGQSRVATAWRNGDRVALVHGAQGGFMIRPALDVSAIATLDETAGRACIGVRMTPAQPADASPTIAGVMARRIAGTAASYHIPALFGLLSFGRDVDGVAVALTLDIQTTEGYGQERLTVVPDSTIAY